LFLIQVIIYISGGILNPKSQNEQVNASEKMLFSLIEEMPVGVIIHNKNREIIKVNKVAASQYSYLSETEMQGKIFLKHHYPTIVIIFQKTLEGLSILTSL